MRKILIIVTLSCLAALTVGYTLYNKKHRSVENERAIELTAIDLFTAYETNETEANTKYLDKTLAVSGVISEITTNQDGNQVIILGTDDPIFGIHCTLVEENKNVIVGNAVTIKGICTGYLSDVVLTSGILTE